MMRSGGGPPESACVAARAPMVAIDSSEMCLLSTPVRDLIHSALTPMRGASSSAVSTRGGKYRPMLTILARIAMMLGPR